MALFGTKKNKKTNSDNETTILFATDIHGSEQTFRKFINASKIYKVNACILGGDITGKMIVPLVRKSDGTVSVDYQGESINLTDENEIDRKIELIKLNGTYPYLADEDEFEKFKDNPSLRDEIMNKLIKEQMISWVELAESRLNGTGINCYVTGGNDDPFFINDILDRGISNIHYAEDKAIKINSKFELVSTGWGNMTPWKCPRDIAEDELEAKLETMVSNINDFSKAIFNFHVPPYNSTIDACPKLDTTVSPPKPIIGESISAGSTAVRKIIEKYQPLMGLHGHIHESRGYFKINKTVCFNPGSEYSEGLLRAVLVKLDDNGIKSYQFISG